MRELQLIAIKAAALRKFAEPEFPGGVREGETGLGVPGFGTGPKPQPMTAADRAALEDPAVKALNGYSGTSSKPTMGGKQTSSMLSRLLKSRGGKAGIGLTALGGLGYGLSGRTVEAPPGTPPEQSPEQQPVPAQQVGALSKAQPAMPPPEALHPRQAVRHSALGHAGDVLGSWWNRMRHRYG